MRPIGWKGKRMINSREKGARFERTLARIFKGYGYDEAERTAQHCGKNGDAPDVRGLPYIHVEAKHYKKQAFNYEWMDQAKREAGGNLPAVFHKTDNHEILVTMTLDDWFTLYREFESSMALAEENPFEGIKKAVEDFNKATDWGRKDE